MGIASGKGRQGLGGKILLVEDEAVTRLALTQFLSDEGYSVVSTASTEEALRLMDAQAFDLVISDYEQRQGRVNGLHVLTVFNNVNPGGGKLLITGYLPGELPGGQTRGAIHITKPIDLDHLLLNVKTLLQS